MAHNSLFLPFINLSSSSFRRSPSLPIALYSFVSHCFRVEWAWSVGFGLNVSCHHHHHRLPLKASILFLILTIPTEGIDVNHRSCFSFSPSPLEASILISGFSSILLGLFFWFSIGGLCEFRCGLWVWVGGCVVKKWIFYLNKCV